MRLDNNKDILRLGNKIGPVSKSVYELNNIINELSYEFNDSDYLEYMCYLINENRKLKALLEKNEIDYD